MSWSLTLSSLNFHASKSEVGTTIHIPLKSFTIFYESNCPATSPRLKIKTM
jgi:hypothetical protein